MSYQAIKRLVESKKLPIGHVERKKAQIDVDSIYEKSREIENRWKKRFGKRTPRNISPRWAMQLCNRLCDQLGEKRIISIVINSVDVQLPIAADYWKRKIRFPRGHISLFLLIHELTHHFCPKTDHGSDFCKTLEFLFEIAYPIITKKPLKKHWEIV